MICPYCKCVFCVDDDLYLSGTNRKTYCSATCKNRARIDRSPLNRKFTPTPARRESLKAKLWRRQKGICALCGERMVSRAEATLDHKRPRSHGGGNSDSNLQLAHKACNELRKDSCPGCPECANGELLSKGL